MFTELTIECSLHGLQSPQIWSNMNKLHPREACFGSNPMLTRSPGFTRAWPSLRTLK
jgi:hypothetical protein